MYEIGMLNGLMPKKIENLKKNIRGLKTAHLLKDRDVVFSEFDDSITEQLLNSIYYFVNAVKEIKPFWGMMITARNREFFIFYCIPLFAGILADASVNFPFLKFLAMGTLESFEPKRREEEVDEIKKIYCHMKKKEPLPAKILPIL